MGFRQVLRHRSRWSEPFSFELLEYWLYMNNCSFSLRGCEPWKCLRLYVLRWRDFWGFMVIRFLSYRFCLFMVFGWCLVYQLKAFKTLTIAFQQLLSTSLFSVLDQAFNDKSTFEYNRFRFYNNSFWNYTKNSCEHKAYD